MHFIIAKIIALSRRSAASVIINFAELQLYQDRWQEFFLLVRWLWLKTFQYSCLVLLNKTWNSRLISTIKTKLVNNFESWSSWKRLSPSVHSIQCFLIHFHFEVRVSVFVDVLRRGLSLIITYLVSWGTPGQTDENHQQWMKLMWFITRNQLSSRMILLHYSYSWSGICLY